MPDPGVLIPSTPIRVVSIEQDVIRPAKVEFATIRYGEDPYEGPYEVTPTEEEQVLAVTGKTGQRNITVNPIPDNYGRLQWSGNTLTVY